MEAIINKVFAREGGYFDHNKMHLAHDLREVIRTCTDLLDELRKEKPDLPVVDIVFLDNYLLGACAGRDNETGKYYIGINIGTYFLLLDVFYRMMSHREVYPDVGDIEKCDDGETLKLWNPQIVDLNILVNVLPESKMNVPVDVDRKDFGVRLFLNCISVLFLHEYAHIVFGHLGLILDNQNLIKSQNNNYSNDVLTFIDMQTLELDADMYALNRSCREILKHSIEPSSEGRTFSFYEIAERLEVFVFSAYSMFRLFGYSNTSCSLSHPTIAIRQGIIFAQINHFFKDKFDPLAVNDLNRVVGSAIRKVEDAFQSISEQKLDSKGVLDAFTDASNRHVARLLKNWALIRPKLLSHAFVEPTKVTNQ